MTAENQSQTNPDEVNWVDLDEVAGEKPKRSPQAEMTSAQSRSPRTATVVETAFFASTAGLIWLINYYFPLGPLLQIFFAIPIAFVYLRRGARAAWMATLVASLLLSVLMGPNRSIMFLMPFGFLGVQLGACWRRGLSWGVSIGLGTLLGSIGFFFRFWLLSFLLGEDLWRYSINQITALASWLFIRLGILAQPDPWIVQAIALVMVLINNLIYVLVVHLVALFLLDRLGNPIPRPPEWIQTIIEYD
ncbi:MAG: DUF2232 domain-containing protein [Jaaginema sp. PMC 1079.18]|nr:DUF2232 domain-containing protein [Jaaginema sp. PMC 1080.18]MEC4851462.1 DUF2232 domain-containing protein [Jaaginema sp. PMC 1079.18]MEC4865950.1 DUF2232 domain-containing protein [Jaaginema sp. PMC 1078.18]